MRPLVFEKFQSVTEKYFGEVTKIEREYFLNGNAISNAKASGSEDTVIFMLESEYVSIKNIKMTINVFRFLANKHVYLKDSTNPKEIIDYYESIVLGLIKFDKKVAEMNTLPPELCRSNPSESMLMPLMDDFVDELNNTFIYKSSDDPIERYIEDITRSLISMIGVTRILFVNSSFIGLKSSKYFVTSHQLMRWLDSTMKEIKDMVANI